jgi:hypothetical protein
MQASNHRTSKPTNTEFLLVEISKLMTASNFSMHLMMSMKKLLLKISEEKVKHGDP